MRKGLYWTIIVICIVTFFMLKNYVCIRCIEIEENIRLTTSSETINEIIFKHMYCPNCK